MKWGLWGSKFTTTQYLRLIEECVEAGITSFDHADIYGEYTTEEEFGNALKEKPLLRKKIQIITKCGIKIVSPRRTHHKIKSYDTSKKHICSSVENSLQNLGTDYVDILLIHRPDALMHPQEIAEAFLLLKQQGKALHFGVSNFTATQMQLLNACFAVEFNQLEVSVAHLDPFHNGQLDYCLEKKIIPMAWSPMGGGKLLHAEEDNEKYRRIKAVTEILAEKYNAEPQQILIAFLNTHPSGIIPVMGTSKIERLKLALEAKKIKLEREEWYMLWRASTGHEVP